MATGLEDKAREAFVDDDFQSAVDLYTQAINLNPRSADLFADRAQANIKLNNFTEAVADSNKAIELDLSMAKAYLRKGTACFKLEEYHTAKAALEKGASLAQNDSRFSKLISECDQHISGDLVDVVVPFMGESISYGASEKFLKNPGDRVEVDEQFLKFETNKAKNETFRRESLVWVVGAIPKHAFLLWMGIKEEISDMTKSLTPEVPQIAGQDSVGSQSLDKLVFNLEEDRDGRSESCQRKEVESVIPKYRHSFYQKPEEVIVTIFAKGVPSKNVSIDYGEQILSVLIDVPGENKYHYQPRLFGKIIPDKCRFEVLSTKVEIRLVKAEAINWSSLEYSKDVAVPYVNASPALKRPSYPSSKPRTTDWDKLEAQVKKELVCEGRAPTPIKSKQKDVTQEKEEKLDGDAGVNKLFGDIYKNADEDTRRAMMKSFVESNGTVLSTNWQDVGAKKVEGSPPNGMELKKWEY